MSSTTANEPAHRDGEVEKVVIIGSGPAGWTAAIYAARANLNPVCFVGVPKQTPTIVLPGGQLMLTTEVENYPGFPEGVTGPEMMMHFQKQAERFGTRVVGEDIIHCDFSARPFTLTTSTNRKITAHAVILATGATANWLGLDNEMRLAQTGGGVSACAVGEGALLTEKWRTMGEPKEGDMYFSSWGNGSLDPEDIFVPTHMTDARGNSAGYSNSEIDRLLDEAATELDRGVRASMYQEAEAIVNAEVPYVYLWVPQDIYGVSKRVSGWSPSPDGRINLHDACLN